MLQIGEGMSQLPSEDDTPFSLPHDVPENMPIDYPELDNDADIQEVYDEGLEDAVDFDPYSPDDDVAKIDKRITKGSSEYYTINHAIVRRWAQHRYGHPAHIIDVDNGLEAGGLYITFEDDEPEIETEPISWKKFFNLFEKNNLAFLYRTKTQNGTLSKFYAFIDRSDVARTTDARRVV